MIAGVGERGVCAVAGTGSASAAMMAAARVYDGELPAISPTASTPDLSGISSWVFRVIPSDSATGLGIAGDETLDLRIELGRTQIRRDEALKLRTGAVIPLDGAANEPVSLLAGGRLVARGELLVLDGKLGVRVVEVVSRIGN